MALAALDVSEMLSSVKVRALVAHATHDQVIPVEAGRELAQGIPGAEFLELESENHVLLEHEPAWPEFIKAVRAFLGR